MGFICEIYLKGLLLPHLNVSIPEELKSKIGNLSEEEEYMILVADDEKIRMAVRRAEDLHVNKQDLCPRYFATTVYLLLRKIMDMLPEVRE